MAEAKCPGCGNTIDHLDFESDVTQWGHEWGTCDIDGDNQDWGDSEFNDGETNETRYKCPDCEYELDLSELEEIEEEEEEKELNEDGEEISQAPEPTPKIKFVEPSPYNSNKVESLICPECGNVNPIGTDEKDIMCIKCGADLVKDKVEAVAFGNIIN